MLRYITTVTTMMADTAAGEPAAKLQRCEDGHEVQQQQQQPESNAIPLVYLEGVAALFKGPMAADAVFDILLALVCPAYFGDQTADLDFNANLSGLARTVDRSFDDRDFIGSLLMRVLLRLFAFCKNDDRRVRARRVLLLRDNGVPRIAVSAIEVVAVLYDMGDMPAAAFEQLRVMASVLSPYDRINIACHLTQRITQGTAQLNAEEIFTAVCRAIGLNQDEKACKMIQERTIAREIDNPLLLAYAAKVQGFLDPEIEGPTASVINAFLLWSKNGINI